MPARFHLTTAEAQRLGLVDKPPKPKRTRKLPELIPLPDGRIQVLGHIYRIAGTWATCERCGLGMAVQRLPQFGAGYWMGE